MSGRVGPLKPLTPPFINTYSMEFDGVDDYLDLGTESTAANGGQFTFSFWIKGNSQSGARYLFSADYYNLHTFWTIQNTELYWRNINNNYKLLSSNLLDGDWHHILIVYNPDGADETIRCFTDGTNQVDVVTDFRYRSVGGFYDGPLRYIGNRGGGTFLGFNGNIDEFAVWNDDQSANISTIYNGGAPNDLTDLSPDYWLRNGDNGSYKSPQWLLLNNENKDKVSNYSLEFDGIDDKVELSTQSLGITGAISVSAWVKIPTTNTGGGGTNIQYFVGEDRTNLTNRNWVLSWRGGGLNRISGVIFDSGGTAVAATTNAIVPNDGNWHHVMFTYAGDTSTDGLKLFVDGIQRAQATSLNGGTRSTTNVVPTIGGISQGIARMFEGNIDEVSIFTSVVDIADVWDGSGEPINVSAVSGIVSYYKMGEEATFVYGVNPDGTWTIPDQVGSNDGTSNNLMADSARVGTAPSSSNNAVSFNMDLIDRVEDTP